MKLTAIYVSRKRLTVAVTPQVRKALTRTGALAAAFGARVPLVSYPGRQFTRWAGYLLWDYRDPVRSRR